MIGELPIDAIDHETERTQVHASDTARRLRITMLLENVPYPEDARVRSEAESLVNAGNHVEIIAPRATGQPKREWVNGVHVRRFRTKEAVGDGAGAMLREYLVAGIALHAAAVGDLWRGTQVLHIHNPPDLFFLAAALFRLARRKVIFDHHDLTPELVSVKFGPGIFVRLAKLAERLTFAAANHVLAANESHAEIARGRGRKAREAVSIVRNGPPASWTRLPIRIRDGALSSVRLAYLGVVAEQDGVDALARVLKYLREYAPHLDARLTVIGDGTAREALEAELERCGVSGNATIMGFVPREQVPVLLQQADVCVDPAPATLLNERSTMTKVAEYLALGKPVVAYDLLETRRTVGDAALLVASGDEQAFARQIARLAGDPILRRTLSERARRRAQSLTWESSVRSLLAAYAKLAGHVQRDERGVGAAPYSSVAGELP